MIEGLKPIVEILVHLFMIALYIGGIIGIVLLTGAMIDVILTSLNNTKAKQSKQVKSEKQDDNDVY